MFSYDTYCLKSYIQRRTNVFDNKIQIQENPYYKIDYHASTTVNNITSFLSYLSAIPTVQSLPKSDRIFLCKHNVRPLILLNLHELEQLCFSEPWQVRNK